jgi:hypothetical protein
VSDFYHDDPIESENPRRKITSTLITGVLFVAGFFYFQSTLAANISVNSGADTEFGQGITQTVTCAGSPEVLTVTPGSTFVNVSGTGSHYLKSIRVDGIPSSCKGVDFSLSGFDDSSSSALTLFDASTIAAKAATITMRSDSTFLPVNSGDITVTTNSSSSFTASLDSPAALSTSVAKVTIQSATHRDAVAVSWISRTSAADNPWAAVTYGNGLFVAVDVAPSNGIMTSPDGITWTQRVSLSSNAWKSVTFGNGLFVAVSNTGTGNRATYSADGINWTLCSGCTSGIDSDWVGITHGKGLFVAVASSGFTTSDRIMTSPNGVTWTLGASPNPNVWNSVTYGNGIFVAVASSGGVDRVMTSIDAFTWTLRTSASNNNWKSVTYGNGLFVAVAYSGIGNRVMTSPDGITWTSRSSAADNDWQSVTYGNGLFIAVASSGTGNRIMTSPDGFNWTTRTSAADNSWQGVAYGNGIVVAVSSSGTGNRVMTSN